MIWMTYFSILKYYSNFVKLVFFNRIYTTKYYIRLLINFNNFSCCTSIIEARVDFINLIILIAKKK